MCKLCVPGTLSTPTPPRLETRLRTAGNNYASLCVIIIDSACSQIAAFCFMGYTERYTQFRFSLLGSSYCIQSDEKEMFSNYTVI